MLPCSTVAARSSPCQHVEVTASALVQDGHTETPALDADFALVISGISSATPEARAEAGGMALDVVSDQPGQLEVRLDSVPPNFSHGYTLFSLDTDRRLGAGELLGLERDDLTRAVIQQPILAGSVFHFAPGGSGQYPQAPFSFPAPVALALQGLTFDAVVVLMDQNGQVMDVSNVDRVTVQ